jgi:hypothetical protein
MTDREMIDQWLVVGLERGEAARFSDDATLRADCAVGFVYVDSMCGMTFNVEAWCNTDGKSLLAVSRPSDTKQRIMLRYDTFAGKAKRMLTQTERAALVFPTIPDWLSLYYQGDETTRALRALPLLDPVRAPGYPDDIKCFLFDRSGSKAGESIWAKVIRQGGDGCFLCRLLNEPYQDFGVHEGEMVSVALAEQEDGPVAVCLGKPTGKEYE